MGRTAAKRLTRCAQGSTRAIPLSSSTPRARPGIPRVRSCRMARTWPQRATWSSTIRRWRVPGSAPSSICRCATSSGGTLRVTLAAAGRAHAALRRGGRRPAAHTVRSGAYGILHGAALSAEVRLAGADPHRQHQPGQGARPTSGDASAVAMQGARWDGSDGGTPRFTGSRARWCSSRCSSSSVWTRLELVICGGAPLPAQTMALWQIWGVNLVEIYGQTEQAGAIISGQRGPFPRPGNVGTVAPGWELKLADDGEILVRGATCSTNTEQPGSDARGEGRGRLAAHRRHRRAEDSTTARCRSSTVRATSSSPPAARRCRPRSSRT